VASKQKEGNNKDWDRNKSNKALNNLKTKLRKQYHSRCKKNTKILENTFNQGSTSFVH
jgi:hypothetical protein